MPSVSRFDEARVLKRDPLTLAPTGVDLRFALLRMTGIAEEIKVKIIRLSFFGQALNNTSERSEVSLFSVLLRSIDFSPFGRRPLVHVAQEDIICNAWAVHWQCQLFAPQAVWASPILRLTICCWHCRSAVTSFAMLSQHFLPSVGKPTPPLKEGEELFPKP